MTNDKFRMTKEITMTKSGTPLARKAAERSRVSLPSVIRASSLVTRRWLAAVVLVCFASLVARAEPAYTEYQVKALFLFNFAKYVDWPAEAFADANAPLVIGIVGQDRFKDSLKQAVEGKTVNADDQRRVRVGK